MLTPLGATYCASVIRRCHCSDAVGAVDAGGVEAGGVDAGGVDAGGGDTGVPPYTKV